MAPLALSRLASIITRIEDGALRTDLAQWAAEHIETIHINVKTPLVKGRPTHGLSDWDLRIFRENILKTLYGKIGMVETMTEDGAMLTQRVGVVIIKD